jgi:hypothetical protein
MEKKYELKDTDVVIELTGLPLDTLRKLGEVTQMVHRTTELKNTVTQQIQQHGVYVPFQQHSHTTLILHDVSQVVVDTLDDIFKEEV